MLLHASAIKSTKSFTILMANVHCYQLKNNLLQAGVSINYSLKYTIYPTHVNHPVLLK